MKKIYYDNAATTPVDARILKEAAPFLREKFGNPGSIHSWGQTALSSVDNSRDKVADFLGCSAQEIIFTSGATESNNLAVQGVVRLLAKGKKIHLVMSTIEHPSVLEIGKALKKNQNIEVDFAPVDSAGVVKLEMLAKLIKPETVLVSIMYANNEVGSIQPVKEISAMIAKERERRQGKGLPIYFHVDAVQAINYLDCRVDNLGVDFLSFSGHKIYAPKGIGALYIRRGIRIEPICYGGHYEYNLRPGTLNVAGIVAIGKAVELVKKEQSREIAKLKRIKNKLVGGLGKISAIKFNGEPANQLPNIINVSFKNAEGESILMMLDMAGIAVSTGSACSSGSLEPSHVLRAMGVASEWSHGSVRISLGRFNQIKEIPLFLRALDKIILKLREMAPLK